MRLDNTLDEFFKDVPEEKKKITVKQLLTHTSGIERYPIPAEIGARNDDVIAAFILSFPLSFTPGSRCSYSCAGMMLLAYILEKIYGQTLDELFFVKIKHPLGIDRMRFNIALDEENAANCNHQDDIGLRRMDDDIIRVLRNGMSGAGGSFWSIQAMNTLARAILRKDERLYKEEFFALAEQGYTADYAENRGLGYDIDNMKGPLDLGDLFSKGSFGHIGWTGCLFFINREKNLYAIILSNTRRCIMMHPEWDEYVDGKDMAYVQLRDVLNAASEDLREQGLL